MAGAGTQKTENGVCSEVNSFALKVGCSDDKVVSRYLAFVNVKIRIIRYLIPFPQRFECS